MISNRTQRTPITEVIGDAPATPTPEDLAKMSPDQRHDAANAWWLAALPPVGPAPTVQPTRTLSDLLDG